MVIGPEAPLVAGLADRLADAGIAHFGPTRGRRAAGGLQGVCQGGHGQRRRADGAVGRGRDRRRGHGGDRRPLPDRHQVRRAGRRQGRRRGARRGRPPARRWSRCSRSAASARAPSSSRSSSTARSCRSLPSATASAPSRWSPPRTTSASSTATRARTPAAWAPTARSPARRIADALVARDPPAGRRPAARARHAVPRRPLRRADAHRRRPAGHRVQRALRRPRDPGRPAAPAQRPAGDARRRRPAPAAWRAPRWSSATTGP